MDTISFTALILSVALSFALVSALQWAHRTIKCWRLERKAATARSEKELEIAIQRWQLALLLKRVKEKHGQRKEP